MVSTNKKLISIERDSIEKNSRTSTKKYYYHKFFADQSWKNVFEI